MMGVQGERFKVSVGRRNALLPCFRGGERPTAFRDSVVARGQSTLEYLLVAVAVLLAVLYGVRSVLEPKVEERLTQGAALINKAGTEFKNATVGETTP